MRGWEVWKGRVGGRAEEMGSTRQAIDLRELDEPKGGQAVDCKAEPSRCALRYRVSDFCGEFEQKRCCSRRENADEEEKEENPVKHAGLEDEGEADSC